MNSPQEILLATTNQGKIKEMKELFKGKRIKLITPLECGITLEVHETGENYYENAAIKARAWAKYAQLPTIADDSGLEVAVLGGKPGINSARYHPKKGASDAERREYLLRKLAPYPQPWVARFVCVLCYATLQGEEEFAYGECNGIIISKERGSQGFGYDPIFYIPAYAKTMAELSLEQKNQISHRAQAVHAALNKWF